MSATMMSFGLSIVLGLFVMGFIALVSLPVWGFMVSMLITWVCADFIMSMFSGGGRGAGRVPSLGKRIQPMNTVFMAFFLGILIASLVGSGLAESIVSNVSALDFGSVLALSVVASLLVFVDMWIRIYRR